MIAGFPFIASSMDSNARAFCQTSGATDRAAINYFVKGIKRLGLWDDMVCWPLRSAQNAGTGTTAYSLGGLGTFNGTLVNGPTWGADGMTFGNSSTPRIDVLNVGSTANIVSFYAVRTRTTSQTSFYNSLIGSGQSGSRIAFIADKNGADAFLLAHYGGNSPTATFQSDWRGVLGVSKSQSASSLISRLETNGFASETSYPSFPPIQNINRITIGNEPNNINPSLSYAGTISFAAFFPTDLSNQFAVLTNLYKSTLGQGLGLP